MLRFRSGLSAGRSGFKALSALPRSAGVNPALYLHKSQYAPIVTARQFSSGGTDGFRETLNKINKKATDSKEEDSENNTKEGDAKADTKEADAEKTGEEKANSENPSVDYNDLFRKSSDFATDAYVTIKDNISMAWADLTGASKQTTLRRTVMQAESFRRGGETPPEDADDDEKEKYDGPTAMVVVKDRGSAWDQMKSRLSSSPLIREMLKNSKKVKDAAASTDIGKKAFETGQNVKDKMEDVREYWETSQNPLVYKISGVWDSLTGETEEGVAISEICKLDPAFIKEDWNEEVKATVVPLVINCHLRGDLTEVKPWLGEAVYNKLSADIKARKADGIVFDTNVLDIDENATIIRLLEGEGAVIVVIYMVQQINCIRNKEGDIIEGGEDEVRAKFYSIAFKQVYNEDDGLVQWTVVDYEFAGDIPYL